MVKNKKKKDISLDLMFKIPEDIKNQSIQYDQEKSAKMCAIAAGNLFAEKLGSTYNVMISNHDVYVTKEESITYNYVLTSVNYIERIKSTMNNCWNEFIRDIRSYGVDYFMRSFQKYR